MSILLPLLEHVDSFIVKGFSVITKNQEEFSETTAKIPKLWQQFHASELGKESQIFSVYSDYESETHGLYKVTVGTVNKKINLYFEETIIQKGQYLAFHNKGPLPSTVLDTWQFIWDYFSKNTNYQRTFISDFEVYEHPNQITIYIGVH